MGFKLVTKNTSYGGRRQGPAKITVVHANNLRTQITLSGATRDWLQPTPAKSEARWPDNRPSMKVAVLVDQDTRQMLIRRLDDSESGEHVYAVSGLSANSSAYITDRDLENSLGLLAGHYFCKLIEEENTLTRAALIEMDEGTPIKSRKSQPTESTSTRSADEQQRIDEIHAVIDEGINTDHSSTTRSST